MTSSAVDLRTSYRFCNEISRRQAKNFYYSFLLLPPRQRRSMCALYAFLRHTDDLADEPGPAPLKREALNRWRVELDRALEGDPSAWPGLPALAETVQRHQVPSKFLHAVIDGVEMDLEPKPFLTFQDLRGYCFRVASAVGLSCIHIWGYRSESGLAERLAESCGIALQLTNILRDVREDAEEGRVYLPREDLERFRVSTSELTHRVPSDRVRDLFAFQARRAYEFYSEGSRLIRLVAPVGRPVLAAIVGIYRALLDEIARRNYNVLDSRVALPAWQKAMITMRALSGRLAPGSPIPEGPSS